MIYVVTCENYFDHKAFPIGYFHTREEAQRMVDFKNCCSDNSDLDDESLVNYEVCEIDELSRCVDYDNVEYQYGFKAYVTRDLNPPHKLRIDIFPQEKQIRKETSLWIKYRENIITFSMTLFDEDKDQAEWIAREISDKEFKINCEPSDNTNGCLIATEINNESNEYEGLLDRYITMYKELVHNN